MTAPNLPLCINVQRRDEGALIVVHVSGELDMATAPVLDAQLIAAQTDLGASAPLVLDVSDLSFLSSAGLVLLVTHHERYAEQGHRLWVVTGENRRVLRPVRLTGLDTVLNLVSTVADVLPDNR